MNEKIEAVQRIQDYINDHLYDDITLSDLSNVSFFSPWYARKIFIELLGVTPAEYIRKLKLKTAALKLRDEKVTIIDVSYECGYDSVDGFQRAFYKEFGCNPKEYSLNPVPIQLFVPYGVKYNKMNERNLKMSTRSIYITVIEKPLRKVIIKRGIKATHYFEYCNEVGCDVWGILTSIKSLSNEPVCLWLPKELIKPNTSEYVQGTEVAFDYDGPVPKGFEVIELPKTKYLLFQGEPFEEENFEQAIYEIWESEKKYDPSIIGYKWDDKNPKIQLEPIGKRGYIELLPIIEK